MPITRAHFEQLQNECDKLDMRIIKLRDFIDSAGYSTLPVVDQVDIGVQLHHMTSYWDVLDRRIDRYILDGQITDAPPAEG